MRSAIRAVIVLLTYPLGIATGIGVGLWIASFTHGRCPPSFGNCFEEQSFANWQSAVFGLLAAVIVLACGEVAERWSVGRTTSASTMDARETEG
jgi:MFS superfamily sulfate permease-like transporter